jgi:hypothetical protein
MVRDDEDGELFAVAANQTPVWGPVRNRSTSAYERANLGIHNHQQQQQQYSANLNDVLNDQATPSPTHCLCPTCTGAIEELPFYNSSNEPWREPVTMCAGGPSQEMDLFAVRVEQMDYNRGCCLLACLLGCWLTNAAGMLPIRASVCLFVARSFSIHPSIAGSRPARRFVVGCHQQPTTKP